MIGIGDRAFPNELGMTGRVVQTPIGADAAFENLPRLVERLDDVVLDAVGLGARDEVAQDERLLGAAGHRILQIVARARPAEFGDHDAFAGIGLAQFVVDDHRLIDRLRAGEAFPIGQDVRGDVIDLRDQLGMIHPDVPDFAGRHRHAGRALDALDHLDEVGDALVAAEDGFVADDDAFDVAVAAGQVDRRSDLALVALLVLVDPGADRDVQAEFGGNGRHQLDAAGRGIEPDRARDRREHLHVGADALGGRLVAFARVGAGVERRVGNAGELVLDRRRAQVGAREGPQRGLHARHEGKDGGDDAHVARTIWGGRAERGARPLGPAEA